MTNPAEYINPLLAHPDKYPFAHYPNSLKPGEIADGIKISPKTGKVVPKGFSPNYGTDEKPRNPFGHRGNPDNPDSFAARDKKYRNAVAMCEKMGCNPFEILLAIASNNKEYLRLDEDDVITVTNRLKAAIEATKFVMPSLKALEIEDKTDKTKTKTIVILPSNNRETQESIEQGREAVEAHINSGINPRVFEIPTVTQEELDTLTDDEDEE